MTAIFISHRSTDDAHARELKAWLEEQGHARFFLDFDPAFGIPPGRDWKQEIYDGLRKAQAILVVLTPDWLDSRWCFAELAIAEEKGKAVFVVRVKPTLGGPLIPSLQEVDLTGDRATGLVKLARGLKACGLDPAEAFDWKPDRPIYPGLAAFDVDDAAIFFGRGAESGGAVEALRSLRQQAPGEAKLLLITGASGSGKSSVMRAGVIARLRKEPASWIVARPFRRGTDAMASFAEALAWAWPEDRRPDPKTLIHRLQSDSSGDQLVTIARELRFAWSRPDATLVLAIDQAEELLAPDAGGSAGRLLDLLRNALGTVQQELVAVATLRSDTLGEWQSHDAIRRSGAHDELRFQTLPLGPMPVDRVPEIVRRPADYVGLVIEDDLVAAIHNDIGTSDALPLLAYTLERLHRDFGRDGRLTLDDYKALGRLEGSVRIQAERAIDFDRLSDHEREALRAAFVPTLVRATESGGFVRQRAFRDQLDRRADPLIAKLVAARLLATDADAQGRETIEIAHEALLRVWPMLANWVADDADRLRAIDALRRAAEEWRGKKQHPDFLAHRGERLGEIAKLVSEPRFMSSIGAGEHAYLAACRDAQARQEQEDRDAAERELQAARKFAEEQRLRAEAEERRAEKEREVAAERARQLQLSDQLAARRRWQTRAALAASVVLLGLLGVAAWQWDKAARQTEIAEAQKKDADEARAAAEASAQRLADINEQLRSSRSLRFTTAPDERAVVGPNWYHVASLNANASVVIVGDNAAVMASGFLAKGELFRSQWTGKTLLITASHVIGECGSCISPDSARFVFPAIDRDVSYPAGRLLFAATSTFGISVLEVDAELPRNATVIEALVGPAFLDRIGDLQAPGATSGSDLHAPPSGQLEKITTLSYGTVEGGDDRSGFSFLISVITGKKIEDDRTIIYRHNDSGPGASGAPVYDAESGGLICVHQGATRPGITGRPTGSFCSWIYDDVQAINSQS